MTVDRNDHPVERPSGQARAWRALFLAGVTLALIGYLGPWVAHETAALTVTGVELSWFAKFFPQVDSGIVPVRRVLFFAPPVVVAVLLGLWVNRPPDVALSRRGHLVWRFVRTALAVLPVLPALPPYDFFLAPEYRAQLIFVAGGALMVVLTLLVRWLPRPLWAGLFTLLALVGPSLAIRQFFLLRPMVVELYGDPFSMGWGMIVCLLGFCLLLGRGLVAGWYSLRRI